MQSKQILGLTAAFLTISTISNLKPSQAATITVQVTDSMSTQIVGLGNPLTTTTLNPNPPRQGQPYTSTTTFNWTEGFDIMTTPKELTYDDATHGIKKTIVTVPIPSVTRTIKEIINYSWNGTTWVEANRSSMDETFKLSKKTITHEVVAIPEPLTILGASTAIGFGAYFKRKLSEQVKNKA